MPTYTVVISYADKFFSVDAPNANIAEQKVMERSNITNDCEVDGIEVIREDEEDEEDY